MNYRRQKILAVFLCLALLCLGGCDGKSSRVAPDQILIPVGPFIMGSDRVDSEGLQQRYGLVKPLYVDEHPQHSVELKAFYIDRLEVSNARYKAFARATGRAEPFEWTQNGYNVFPERLQRSDADTLRWIATEYFKLDTDTRAMSKDVLLQAIFKRQRTLDTLPVTGVSWQDADAFCRAQGQRLPTEAEWEKTARGTDGREFPWGNEWNPDALNSGDNTTWDEGIAPVGTYPSSRSPYGVYDMAGNVWEWVADDYAPYPGNTAPKTDFPAGKKIVRGGGGGIGHYAISQFFRAAARQVTDPNTTSGDVGFRCAQDANGGLAAPPS